MTVSAALRGLARAALASRECQWQTDAEDALRAHLDALDREDARRRLVDAAINRGLELLGGDLSRYAPERMKPREAFANLPSAMRADGTFDEPKPKKKRSRSGASHSDI